MNLKSIKENLLLLVLGLVFVVLMGFALWYQQRTASRMNEIDTNLKQQSETLKKLRTAPVSPSRENIDTLKANYTSLQDLYSQITNITSKVEITVPERRPIQFQQAMAKTLDRLRRDCESNSIRTPNDFAFGFSRYSTTLPCSGSRLQPESDDCKRLIIQLGKQLAIIEHISDLLITNQVEEIRSIHRIEVEAGQVSGDALDAGPGGAAAAAPAARDSKTLYRVTPFEFQFVGTTEDLNRTGGLRGFLNDLLKSPYFLSIRNVKVDSETIEEKRGGPGAVGFGPAVVVPQPPPVAFNPKSPFPVGPGGQPRPGQPIPQPAFVFPQPGVPNAAEAPIRRNRLIVTVRLELIEFASPQVASAKQPKPGP